MGSPDPKTPRISRQLASIARGLKENYPSIVKSLGEGVAPTARYNQATQEEIAPREQALSSGLYNQYAPEYARTGAGIDLSSIQGKGGEAVRASDTLDRSINPEYFASREASSNKLGQLLGGIDPNRLTGTELENTARGLSRSGLRSGETNVPSNQGAINAALTYGNALNQKRNTVANAINTATSAIPTFRGNDVFGQATGGARSGANVFAGGQGFGGTSSQAGQEGGQGLLGLTGGLQSLRAQLAANRRDALDRTNETLSAQPIKCCFIFMEAYNGKLPWFVRTLRDYWYSKNDKLGNGYKRMAKWLVPLMKKSKFVSLIVNKIMINPITRIGKYYVGLTSKYSRFDMLLHDSWFKLWKVYGRA